MVEMIMFHLDCARDCMENEDPEGVMTEFRSALKYKDSVDKDFWEEKREAFKSMWKAAC